MPKSPRMQLSVEAYMNERQHITLELMGNVSQSTSSEPTSCPDAADIMENIGNGTIAVHSDRAAVTKKQIQVQISTIRRNAVNQGTLAQGTAWSSNCQTALLSWLQTKKDGRARSASASQGSVPMLALPAPVLPAAEMPNDDQHGDGDGGSGSDSSSSDSSSSSTSENPEAEKQKSVEQEATPMSTSTPRALLTQDERVLFQELLDAVGCHQEIEEENDRLRHENQRLKDELAQLKRPLSL